ncbi:MAG: family 10 glycosylhydrolase [Ruminococcus sp.]|nr:family 10 glycosylhydrolase [Ruminococcus sp.]
MKLLAALLCGAFFLCSCQAGPAPEPVFPESVRPEVQPAENGYSPVNFDIQKAVWLPYMGFADYMQGRSQEEFRTLFRQKLDGFRQQGVNTLYIHVHPCGDAYYSSDIFPKGTYLDGDYDPLEIMLEEAHSRGLSVHGWLNPLRCQTQEQMSALPENYIVRQWAEAGSGQAKLLSGRWYLDPSYPEVTELITGCAEELLDRYQLDGLHIDDYFYPSADPEFDQKEFAQSGQTDLAKWRQENCTRFVKALYDTVKSHGEGLRFGISPQGNISADYSSQFADVELWAGQPGYCDYIVPQLYFGFLNQTCPFEETLHQWEELVCPEVDLVIGLAGYKQGAEDRWAGEAGLREWIDDPELLRKQIRMVESSPVCSGYAVY